MQIYVSLYLQTVGVRFSIVINMVEFEFKMWAKVLIGLLFFRKLDQYYFNLNCYILVHNLIKLTTNF